MRDVLHVPADEVTELCLKTYMTNGTTFAGLVVRAPPLPARLPRPVLSAPGAAAGEGVRD